MKHRLVWLGTLAVLCLIVVSTWLWVAPGTPTDVAETGERRVQVQQKDAPEREPPSVVGRAPQLEVPGGKKGSPHNVPNTSPRVPSNDDDATLENIVGEDVASVIEAGGPYEPAHVRTIAHSVGQFEKYLRGLRKSGASQTQLERATVTYVKLQNHYYAALDDIEPYKPDDESARRLEEWKDAMDARGEDLEPEEKKALKREILLPDTSRHEE